MPKFRSFLGTVVRAIGQPQYFARVTLIIVTFALVLRLGILVLLWPSWGWQTGAIPDQWNELAINLVDTHSFGFHPHESTVWRGPIFPLIEVPLYLLFGKHYEGWSISLLLLDTFTCFLLIITSRRLWGNRAAVLAGLFYAAHFAIIYYTAAISQVTTILPMVTFWFYLISRWESDYNSKWLPSLLGLLSGVMILNKTIYLPVPFVCSAILLWKKGTEIARATAWLPILVYLAIAGAVVAPWTIRNYFVTKGAFIPVQSLFWEPFVQDVLFDDLDRSQGVDRPDGMLLDYLQTSEHALLAARGVSFNPPPDVSRPQWEVQREKAFSKVSMEWIKQDPGKIVRVKIANVWHFWTRTENWRKTRILIAMQACYLGAALTGLVLLGRFRQLGLVKFGLALILVQWAEYCLVLPWGRYSLDAVPVLGVIFGLGIDTWIRRSQIVRSSSNCECFSGRVSSPDRRNC
jgi:4-amino-4-deoxy-L-arabinose transferase-like glycosyltransferase